jgi:hypothetical protein
MENTAQEAIEESASSDDEQGPFDDNAAPSDEIECSVPIQASTLETQPKLLDAINVASIPLKFYQGLRDDSNIAFFEAEIKSLEARKPKLAVKHLSMKA